MKQKIAVNSVPRRPLPFWLIFIITFGALLTENLLHFPLSVPRMMELSGGLPILDMRLWYSSQSAYQLLDVLGGVGRTSYLELLWSVDLVLPCLFAIFLSVAIKRGALQRLSWIPLVAAGFDYAENVMITVLLLSYPAHLPVVVKFSSTFTSLKFLGYWLSMLLMAGGYLLQLWKRPKRK